MAAASFEYGNSLFMDRELVLPTGELMRIGLWETIFKGKWSMTGGGGIIGENNAYDCCGCRHRERWASPVSSLLKPSICSPNIARSSSWASIH